MKFRFGRLPTRIARDGALKRVTMSDGETLEVDEVLIATGRRPNTRGLGLESAGVRLADGGAVIVDARSTTNVPSIHAIGDVTDRINLTPVAIREGHWLADRLFGGATREVNYDAVATAVFSTPEIGTVGLERRRGEGAIRGGRHLQGELPPAEGDDQRRRREA